MGCYKCKCNSCINNVNEIKNKDEFIKKNGITCFNCEECYHYDNEVDKIINHKIECVFYIKSDRAIVVEKQSIERRATYRRKIFKVMKRGLANEH